MTVLVTGGAGYIGSHTCVELLNLGYSVIVIDNFSNSSPESLLRVEKITGRKVILYEGDVRDADLLNSIFEMHQIDWVIHFAGLKAVGESCQKPIEYYNNNLYSTLILLDAMRKKNVKKLVFSSSATVYGDPQELPLKETSPIGGTTNPYGTSKYMQERIFEDLCKADSTFTAVMLRYFNPVGAHESGLIGEDPKGIPNNLTPYITKVAIGELPSLGIFGDDYDTKDGTGVRDYIHVVDLAKGHVAAIEHVKEPGFYTYNLGTGIGYSVKEVLHAFEKACGHAIPFVIKPRRPGDIASCYADSSKAKKELHWVAEKTLDEMCESAWNWQSKNPEGYRTTAQLEAPTSKDLNKIARQFFPTQKIFSIQPMGQGHINATYFVLVETGKYVLQKINTYVFKDYEAVIHNIALVTEFLDQKGIETLHLLKTVDGKYSISYKGIWRCYDYIDGTITYQIVSDAEAFQKTGEAYGNFISQLSLFDASLLKEVIPNFHNTKERYNRFLKVLEENSKKRSRFCKPEVDFVVRHESTFGVVCDGLQSGDLPLRVIHNDTKINNILMDERTGEPRAIIDLDTIMPGSLLYDFGDSIRSGATNLEEDDPRAHMVQLDMELFEHYAKGFISGMKGNLTEKELELLPFSGYLMTIECGMRFLTDYLEGDVYFKTDYPDHNLVRARNQFALAQDIEKHMDELNEIIKKIVQDTLV